jgi:ATP-dependent DNA helicase RecG
MGIVADIKLCCEDGHEYITIEIIAHPNAISYGGKYYLRSGSTNQELTGFALDELLLRKYGRTWDATSVPHVRANDFYMMPLIFSERRQFRASGLHLKMCRLVMSGFLEHSS